MVKLPMNLLKPPKFHRQRTQKLVFGTKHIFGIYIWNKKITHFASYFEYEDIWKLSVTGPFSSVTFFQTDTQMERESKLVNLCSPLPCV